MTPLNLAHSPRMEWFLNRVVPSSAMVPNIHCYNISRTGTAPAAGEVVQTVTIHLYSYLKPNNQTKTKKSIVNRYRPVWMKVQHSDLLLFHLIFSCKKNDQVAVLACPKPAIIFFITLKLYNKLCVFTILLINEDEACESPVNITNDHWEDPFQELSLGLLECEREMSSSCSTLLVQECGLTFSPFLKKVHLN